MTQLATQTAASATGDASTLLMFHASNVTGTQELAVEFGPGLSARAVTDSLAHRMAMPSDVAWSLRDDQSSAYLDDDRPIGDQIAPGSHVTITPRTHLGGEARRVG